MKSEEQKVKKPSNSNAVLLILAKKLKIVDEQVIRLRALIDEMNDRIDELEEQMQEEKRVGFQSDFDWGN